MYMPTCPFKEPNKKPMALLKLEPKTHNSLSATTAIRPSFRALKRLIIHFNGCLEFINMDDIEYIQADSNYSTIHLVSGSTKTISKTLKKLMPSLDSTFIRTHKSYIVNLKHIKAYKAKDSEIQMQSNDLVYVSRVNKSLMKEIFV